MICHDTYGNKLSDSDHDQNLRPVTEIGNSKIINYSVLDNYKYVMQRTRRPLRWTVGSCLLHTKNICIQFDYFCAVLQYLKTRQIKTTIQGLLK